MVPAYSHKESAVYKKNKLLLIETVSFFRNKKLNGITKYLANQLVRAIASVGANLTEGYGRHYKQDYRRFLSISRGSAFEAEYWLEVIIDLKVFPNDKLTTLLKANEEIIKLLTTMMKSLEKPKSRT